MRFPNERGAMGRTGTESRSLPSAGDFSEDLDQLARLAIEGSDSRVTDIEVAACARWLSLMEER